MVDPLTLIGTAIETAKKLRAVADKVKDADTRNLVADLSISLADLKIEIAALKEENLRLQQELDQAKTRRKQAGELVVRDGVLWFEEPPVGKPAGPYCPNCKENRNQLVLIKDQRNTPFDAFGNFHCNQCKSHF